MVLSLILGLISPPDSQGQALLQKIINTNTPQVSFFTVPDWVGASPISYHKYQTRLMSVRSCVCGICHYGIVIRCVQVRDLMLYVHSEDYAVKETVESAASTSLPQKAVFLLAWRLWWKNNTSIGKSCIFLPGFGLNTRLLLNFLSMVTRTVCVLQLCVRCDLCLGKGTS